jgi:hypothetical protein
MSDEKRTVQDESPRFHADERRILMMRRAVIISD